MPGATGQSMLAPPAVLLVQKLGPNATLPYVCDPDDAGCMLCSAAHLVVPARGKAPVRTDLAIAVPEATNARIAPHSWLAWKHRLQVGSCVVGPGYRVNVAVVLFNHADEDFAVCRSDRAAQQIVERFAVPEVVLVPVLPARPLYSPHQHLCGLPSAHPSSAAPSGVSSSSSAELLPSSATPWATPSTSLAAPLLVAPSPVPSSGFAAPVSTPLLASTTAALRSSRMQRQAQQRLPAKGAV